MKKSVFYWCWTVLALLIFNEVSAHGVRGKLFVQNVITMEAEYDDSDPISYAAVEVFSPTGEVCFQSGRTDRNGRFAFCPDENGEWKVIVDDETGHKLVLKTNFDVETAGEQGSSLETGNAQPFSRFQGVVTGLSLIFGIFGLAALLKSRKHRKQ